MNKSFLAVVASFILLTFVKPSIALAPLPLPIDEQKLRQLSVDPVWLKLVHYEDISRTKENSVIAESSIISKEFFLSPKGNTSPYSELTTTILRFINSDNEKTTGIKAFCRFPARLIWLRKKLGEDFAPTANLALCDKFQSWSKQGNIESVSIIFATGYLGNPASFYGHTLLKFNSSSKSGNTTLQDASVNYGAIVPKNENPIAYILKGVFGGYDAGFSHISYYFHEHNYGENELRDMWEYQLDLQQKDVDFLVAHAWEVLGKKYQYYFIKENCAYRMSELFSIIEGIDLTPINSLWSYPQAVVQNLETATYHNKKLLKKIIKHPSRQSRLYLKYSQLTNQEKDIVNRVIQNINFLENEQYQEMEQSKKYRILDTLIDYYQLIRDKEALGEDEANKIHQHLLIKRLSLPIGSSEFLSATEKNSPHLGRKASLLSLAYYDNKQHGVYQKIKIRPAYYDSLDAENGHISFSKLTMGQIILSVKDQKAYLDILDIFHVENANSQAIGLPEEGSIAWNLKLGIEPNELACIDCSVLRFYGDIGEATFIQDKFMLAAYLGGGLQESYLGSKNYFVRAFSKAQINFSDDFRLMLTAEYRNNLDLSDDFKASYQATARYRLDKNWESRLFYQKSETNELGLSVGYYW